MAAFTPGTLVACARTRGRRGRAAGGRRRRRHRTCLDADHRAVPALSVRCPRRQDSRRAHARVRVLWFAWRSRCDGGHARRMRRRRRSRAAGVRRDRSTRSHASCSPHATPVRDCLRRSRMRFVDGKTSSPSQLCTPPATDASSQRRGLHPTWSWWLGESLARCRTQPWMSAAFNAIPRQTGYEREPACTVIASRSRRNYETALSGSPSSSLRRRHRRTPGRRLLRSRAA